MDASLGSLIRVDQHRVPPRTASTGIVMTATFINVINLLKIESGQKKLS